MSDRITDMGSILFQEKYYFIDDGPYLESLCHVIDHYSRMADGLPTNLIYAVPPSMFILNFNSGCT